MKQSTEYAIDTFRKFYGSETEYKTLVLGSLHNINFLYDTNIDWRTRYPIMDANFMIHDLNKGYWNLVINCCCEHMVPMRYMKLPAIYVLQSNNHMSEYNINELYDIEDFVKQSELDEIYYKSSIRINGKTYYTLIGEKY